jgi:hypothetical protein
VIWGEAPAKKEVNEAQHKVGRDYTTMIEALVSLLFSSTILHALTKMEALPWG